MGLDIDLIDPGSIYNTDPLFNTNITHNLGVMAERAGIYKALWRPYTLHKDYNKSVDEEEFEWTHKVLAKDIIDIIESGLKELKDKPEFYRKFDSPNGWGVYEDFVPFIEKYLEALKEYPESIVLTDR